MMTPHNSAQPGDYSPVVLMPGDPARAGFLAEQYLDEVKLVSDVRGMKGYTGLFGGKPVSVLSGGMGEGSMGIYSWELYNHYGVETIIRIGTSAGLQKFLVPGDLVGAMSVSTDGAYAKQYRLPGTFSPCADYTLMKLAKESAEKRGRNLYPGQVFSSVYFSDYNDAGDPWWQAYARLGALAQDMESYALYCNAAQAGKRALSLLTMTDNVVTGRSFADEKRMEGNRGMIEVALDVAYEIL